MCIALNVAAPAAASLFAVTLLDTFVAVAALVSAANVSAAFTNVAFAVEALAAAVLQLNPCVSVTLTAAAVQLHHNSCTAVAAGMRCSTMRLLVAYH